MEYERIYTWPLDYETFKEHKAKKEIQLRRKISEVEFFHMILEAYQREESRKENINNVNADICDGVTG